MRALVNARIVLADGMLDHHAVLVEDGRIVDVVAADDSRLAGANRHDLKGRLLLPGFIDAQVNGGGGVLFNDDPSMETIARIAAAHRKFGTTGFLPTLISDDLAVVARGIAAVDAAIAQGMPGVLGIHIEGPFLNQARKGVHNPEKFRVIDEDSFALLTSLKHGRTLVTLAPEMTTPQMIGRLAHAGVIVAAGHTDATYEQTNAALKAGMTGFTHLFNAMSPLANRAPGVVGAALSDPLSFCGIIVDGRHVHYDVLKLALKTKPHDRFMLVTDALANTGTDMTSFQLQGATITIKDGVCMDERGVLAGSALDMARCVRNARDHLGLDLPDAVAMASRNPAAFLGLGAKRGAIAKTLRADFAVADDELNVIETWIAGAPI